MAVGPVHRGALRSVPTSSPQGAARPRTDGTSQTTFTGPTGTIKQGDATFDVKDGVISFNGKPFGRVDDSGAFEVELLGQRFTGNVAELMGAAITATLSNGTTYSNTINGTVQIGQDSFAVKDGVVFQEDKAIGTVDDKGRYNVSLHGQQATGLLDDIDGATFEGTLADGSAFSNRPNGEFRLGAEVYTVVEGEVSLNGRKLGTLNDDGEFSLEFEGHTRQGNISELAGASFNLTLGDGSSVVSPDQQPSVCYDGRSYENVSACRTGPTAASNSNEETAQAPAARAWSENSWRVKETDPRFWSNNPNVLQQTGDEAISWALSHFGGPTTPEARAAVERFAPGTQDMGAAYLRAVDMQNQNRSLYENILNRVGTTDSPTDRAFAAQLGTPDGYTREQWADLQYRRTVGFGDAEHPSATLVTQAPKTEPVQEEYNPWL